MQPSFRILSLSENAIILDFGNQIQEDLNRKVLALATAIEIAPFVGYKEAVPAYSSLTIFYDLLTVRKHYPKFTSGFEAVKQWIETSRIGSLLSEKPETGFQPDTSQQRIQIPVCYSDAFGPDWAEVCMYTGLSKSEIIQRHTSALYRVYMMGFLPGFAYLSGMDERIAVPRKAQPRARVNAGSIGIAGKQTGIYPLDSPGGWQIIGKTPTKLFNPATETPVLLRAGDEVRFYAINEADFLTSTF